MADPRKFQCPITEIGKTNDFRTFFKGLGKLGSIDVAANSKVSQGFKLLEKISDSIRTGTGTIPASAGSTTQSGAGWVLDQTIGRDNVRALNSFNPGMVNAATNQAATIFTKVKSGHFKNSSDIPGYIQDFTNLAQLAGKIFTPADANTAETVACEISPYAMDIVSLAPKQKFLFFIEIIGSPSYSFVDKTVANMVYKFQLPQAEFDYEEVNLYNFKTRVIKNIKYNPVSITMYDDGIHNSAMNFMKQYINSMSPLSNVDAEQFKGGAEINGMDFTNENGYSATAGLLINNEKSILSQINLYHLFNYGVNMNRYSFFNPRFSDIKFDELTMETSDVSTISATFLYDGIFMESFMTVGSEENRNKLQSDTTIGPNPLRYVSTGSIGGRSQPQ